MKTHLAWILGGGAVLALSAMTIGACSSGDDSNTNDSGGVKDSTVPDTSKGDSAVNDTGPGNDASDAGMGADCKTPNGPFTTDSGPFCPFQIDGGVFAPCAQGDDCCLPATGIGVCQVGACGAAYDGGVDFACNESNDCPTAGEVCCENAGSEIQQDPGCTAYYFVSKQHATTCVQGSCPTGQAQVCGTAAECKNGGSCEPTTTKASWIGICIAADGGI